MSKSNSAAAVAATSIKPIHLTLYCGARFPKPRNQDDFDTWADVVGGLSDLVMTLPRGGSDLSAEDQKITMLAFAPHRLSRPHRKIENVEAITLLVIDVDKCKLDALLKHLKKIGIAAVVYGSPRDDTSAEPRRVRVVAPVSREITPDECGQTRLAFAEMLGIEPGCGVEECLNADRLSFIGRLHDTPERDFIEIVGDPVDVDTLLATPLAHDWKPPKERASARPRKNGGAALDGFLSPDDDTITQVALLVLENIEALESRGEAGARHEIHRATAGYLARRGWTDESITQFVEMANTDDDEEAPTLRIRNALDAAHQARSVGNAPGWGVLASRLGEAGAEELRAAAKDEIEPEGFDGVWTQWWHNSYATGWCVRLEERAREVRTRDQDQYCFIEGSGIANENLPLDSGDQPAPERRTELGNARRLVRMHGDRLRCFLAFKTWFVWDGARWAEDNTGAIDRLAKETVESLWQDALDEDDDRRKAAFAWAAKSQDRSRIANMIALAATEPGVPVTADMLDADPWLLNVQNGTLDLRTGELSEPNPALLMTKCCATSYDPAAQSDLWDAFVKRTTGEDAELAAYIQRALGYALIGAWYEKHFWFGWGPPDGAKSTLLGVVGEVIGDYHVSAEPTTWMVQNNLGGNRGDLTRLRGSRLVTSLEIRPGLRFDEAIVKKVTGGDPVTASAKYKDEIEFQPTFALWMGANDRPTIRDDDEGMWSRMRCVPFVHPIPKCEQDKGLRGKLTSATHAPAVLRWLVEGCLAWQREGLGKCEAVQDASREYRLEMNQAAGFFEDVITITGNPDDEVPCRAMARAYEHWCERNYVRQPVTPKGLGQRLRTLGVQGGDDGSKHTVKRPGMRPEVAGIKPEIDRHWHGVRLAD